MDFLTKIKKRDMKKLLFLIIPLILVGLIACEDRYANDPTCTYKATAGVGGEIKPSSGKAANGAIVPFTVTEDVGYEVDSVTVNGVVVELTNLSYRLKVEDSDYYDINVTFRKTLLLPLIAHPWELVTWYRKDVGAPDTDWKKLNPDIYTLTFSDDGKYNKKYTDGTGLDIGYLLKGDSLILGPNHLGNDGVRTKILVLKEDYMELFHIDKYYQGPGDPFFPDSEIKEVYKKPKP